MPESKSANDARKLFSESKAGAGRWLVAMIVIGLGVVGVALWLGFPSSLVLDFVEAEASVGSEVGQKAPGFVLKTLEGQEVSLGSQAGKPTILFFMAYWCGTCIPEAIALRQIREDYGDKLNILVIDVDSSSTPEFLKEFKRISGDGDFLRGFDLGQEITRLYRVRSLDTTLLLDEKGQVVFRDERPTSYETFRQVLADMDLAR